MESVEQNSVAALQALFSDAPVDSDMFMAYLHQNFPPFCDDIGQCSSLMDYTSAADAIMRMEGDNVRGMRLKEETEQHADAATFTVL